MPEKTPNSKKIEIVAKKLATTAPKIPIKPIF